MSRGFLCALSGIAMTLFAWYGPWAWPAAPAFAVLDHVIGMDYSELPFAQRAAVLVFLIIVNVGAWGLAAYALSRFIRRGPVDGGNGNVEQAEIHR